MRAILALFIVLAVALVCFGTSAAAPGGDVKASPLFKRSLAESIASLEGKALETGSAKGNAGEMPTGLPECPEPEAPLTSFGQPTCYETCSPTLCGGDCYTQAVSCSPTVCGGTCYETCMSSCYGTCISTCSGETCSSTCASTCANTCSGESCSNYCAQGYVKLNGNLINWSNFVNRKVTQYPLAQRWTYFNTTGYYFLADIGSAGQWLLATACEITSGLNAEGLGWRPSQGSPGTYWLDINTLQRTACP
jgi:hypothetical protein